MESLLGQGIFFGMIILFAAAFGFFRMELRRQQDGRTVKIFDKDMDYEIYYRGQLVKEGVFQLKKNEAVRFGFSNKLEYYNQVALENCLDDIEDLDENDVEDMKKRYGTWFSIKLSDRQLWIAPAYTRGENRKGHKTIYLEEKILNSGGEAFDGEIAVYSNEDRSQSFEIVVYDRYEEMV